MIINQLICVWAGINEFWLTSILFGRLSEPMLSCKQNTRNVVYTKLTKSVLQMYEPLHVKDCTHAVHPTLNNSEHLLTHTKHDEQKTYIC